MPTSRKENTTGGIATITITGGTIGTDGKENGMIFGSSRGDVGAPGSIHDKLAWVYDTEDGKFYCQGTFRDIFNPEIDREEHRILSHYIARDGVTRVYSAHYWQNDGNIVTVGDSWTVSPDK
jgi:hypothetical protein